MLAGLGLAAAWLFPVPVSAQPTCVLSNADFKRTVLVDQPAEPMKLTVLPFAVNNWIHVVYDPKSDNHPEGVGRWVSRFTLSNNKLDMASEKKILHVRIDRNLGGGCCH